MRHHRSLARLASVCLSFVPLFALGCSGEPDAPQSEGWTGTLSKSIERRLDGSTRIDYYLKSKSGWLRLVGDEAVLESRTPGSLVRVEGRLAKNGQELLVDKLQSATKPGQISQPLSTNAPPGKVAIFLVKDPSLSDPFTHQDAIDAILGPNAPSTNAFLREASYDQYGLSGDVFGWYEAEMTTCGSYDPGFVAGQVLQQAAAQDGFVSDDYRHTIHIFRPNGPDCFHAKGSIGIVNGTGEVLSYTLSSNAIAHEIGHNLGMHHASSTVCWNSALELVPFGMRCKTREYDDPYDAMGFEGAYAHFSSYRKTYLGWLPESRQLRVTTPGNYTLTAQETSVPDSVQSLIVPTSIDGQLLHVEMRRQFGFDSDDRFDGAVLVRYVHEPARGSQSYLVDMLPDGDLFNAKMSLGQTYEDPISGIKIQLVSKTATEAVVNVAFDAPRCNDGIKNGSETDVDCGGVCAPCAVGKSCERQRDCATVACTTAGQCVESAGGLTGYYFEGTEFETELGTSQDRVVDFDWEGGSPMSSVPDDQFSVRWSGKILPPLTGTYTFRADTDDGARVWVNGQLVVDRWFDGVGPSDGEIALVGGQEYDIRMEYFENGGGAYARLEWQIPGKPMDLIGTLYLRPEFNCTLAGAVDLGPRTTQATVSGDACVKITDYPSWWEYTNGLVTLQSGTGVMPVPATYKDSCSGATGQFVFSTHWQSQPIGYHTADCPVLIQLGGSSNPLQITWW